MTIIKKNIWFIFYIFIFIAISLWASFSYILWVNIYEKYKVEQENLTEFFSQSSKSLFTSQEVMLDVLGKRFVEDSYYKDNIKVAQELNTLRIKTPSLLAFGVTTAEGEYTFLSSHHDVSNLPNLKELPETRTSFLDTLKSDHMVIGRTYYFQPLGEWIYPIRKAIRDKEGNVLIVMTAAFSIEKLFVEFRKNKYQKHSVSITRASDYYHLFSSIDSNNTKLYTSPKPSHLINTIIEKVTQEYNLTIDNLKSSGEVVSYTSSNINGVKMLFSIKYDENYDLWFSVQIPFSKIINEFMPTFTIYTIMFIVISIGFFILFFIVAKAEEKKRKELLHQATHDPLTLLPNRSFLQALFQQWGLKKRKEDFALLYIDLDHFKNINDGFGHQFGDSILIEVAKRLKKTLPSTSIIIHYGGDEFIVILHMCDTSSLLDVAKHLTKVLSLPYHIKALDFILSASIGIAKYPEHAKTYGEIIQAADIAMHEAKKTRNSAYIFNDSMQVNYLKNIHIENELHKAIEKKEFFMVYQPQMDHSGLCYGVESLIRWNNPQLGNIPPNVFIPIAESCGLMPQIGRYIIETVFEEIQMLQHGLGRQLQTSINISISQFLDPDFLNHLVEISTKRDIENFSITLEVTETLFIEDISYILPLLLKIKELGMHISMDDFGTGYSSLSMLRKLPIHELKIDKSFIDDILVEESAQMMIQSIIDIGKNFQMHILAEGVESKEQFDLLLSLKCDRFQGYYFSKPLKKDDLFALLSTVATTKSI